MWLESKPRSGFWDIYHQTPTPSLIMGIYLNVSISNYLALGTHGIFLVWWILPTRLLSFHRKSTVCVHSNQNTKHSSSGFKWTRVYLYSLPLQLGNSLFIFVHSCPTVRTNNRRSAADETVETASGAGTCERTACAGLVWCFGMTHRLAGLAAAQFGSSVHVRTFHPQVFSPSRTRHSLQLHFSVNP